MGRSGPLAPALTPSPHSLGRQAAGKTSAVEKLLGAEEEGTAPFYFKRKRKSRAWNSGKPVLLSLNSNHCFSREI